MACSLCATRNSILEPEATCTVTGRLTLGGTWHDYATSHYTNLVLLLEIMSELVDVGWDQSGS